MNKEKAKLPKDKALIPEGDYCYKVIGTRWNEDLKLPIIETKPCPYLDYDHERGSQECGYCHFMERGDWDKNADTKKCIKDCQTGKMVSASEMPFNVGLLWDGVKECGINNED